MMTIGRLLFGTGILVFVWGGIASAQLQPVSIERAQGERLATATGHYARARSLLMAAVREFDKGQKIVDPSALLNAERFRSTLLDRAEDLERVLDPQPRVTKHGVHFDPDARLLGK